MTNALGESKQVVLDVGGMSCQHPIPLHARVVGARPRGVAISISSVTVVTNSPS